MTRQRRVFLDVDGGKVAALQDGRPGDPAVLLVPGYTGSKEDFAPILAMIADAGFRVTAIDQRGQYESPGWPEPAAYSTGALGADIVALAGRLGGRVHLVGHSFGGLVARAAVLTDPSRFASLVLLDSGPAGIDGGRRERIELLRPVLAQQGMPAVYAAMRQRDEQQPGYVAPPPAVAAFLRERFLAGEPAALFGMADALIGEPDRVADLARAGLPILVLTGVDDDAWPPDVQQQMARRLGTAFETIPAAAHSPAVEQPRATATALVRFWRSVP